MSSIASCLSARIENDAATLFRSCDSIAKYKNVQITQPHMGRDESYSNRWRRYTTIQHSTISCFDSISIPLLRVFVYAVCIKQAHPEESKTSEDDLRCAAMQNKTNASEFVEGIQQKKRKKKSYAKRYHFIVYCILALPLCLSSSASHFFFFS